MAQDNLFSKENIAYWTGRAAGYSSVNQSELASEQHTVWSRTINGQIASVFPARRPQTISVLDVGTGPGFFAILMAEQGYRVTAVDYTPSMLEEAKRNAGELRGAIRFHAMDAEALAFPDEAFDVVLSRNVTWNLHDPEEAYRQWVRVLRPGGLLLNFDANWYRYLYDEGAKSTHLRDRENVAKAGVEDDTAGTDVAAMESIAYKTPLSSKRRPAWDWEILTKLGMLVSADSEIWRHVWTREELINNASTPMFMIAARKNDRAG